MNARIKKLWLEALRSGKYKQAQRKLKTENGFCCLGVLCDLHAKETGRNWKETYYLKSSIVLPYKVRDWAELDSVNPLLANFTTAGYLNDQGFDFLYIANLIEKKL